MKEEIKNEQHENGVIEPKSNPLFEKTKKDTFRTVIKYALIVLTLILIGNITYITYFLLSYQKADQVILESEATYKYIDAEDWYLFPTETQDNKEAIFLYQSSAIDPKAYFYFANNLRKEGYDVFISKSWFNQPVLNVGIVNRAIEEHPSITSWYIGGHGSGAIAVDKYLSKNNRPEIKGAFYLAAAPSDEQLKKSLPVFIAIGSEDGIFDQTKLEDSSQRTIPKNYEVSILDGGNHTNFGYYPLEKGDNKGTLSARRQQDITRDKLKAWIERTESR